MLLLIFLLTLNSAYCVRLPHPRCTYSGVYLSCEQAPLEFPANFNVDVLPCNIQHIDLNCPRSYSRNYCNVLEDGFVSLPFRADVVKVVLVGFKSSTAKRVPIHEFLKNLKQKISTLSIQYSQIGFLDADYFRGFSALTALYLSNNDISAVHVNAFQALTYPAVPVEGKLTSQKLHTVSISHNALQELDWSAFQAIGKSLENLHLESQSPKLRIIYRSGPEYRLQLRTLNLNSNSLHRIPKTALTTITPRSPANFDFDFRWNTFCLSNPDCSCCELSDFFRWMGNTPRTTASTGMQFTCGSKQAVRAHSSSSTFKVDLFRSCHAGSSSLLSRGCYEAPPLQIYCKNGTITTSEEVERSDATKIFVSVDRTHQCTSRYQNLLNAALTMIGSSTTVENVTVPFDLNCVNGTLNLKTADTDNNSPRISFEHDLSWPCQTKLSEFLRHVRHFQEDSPKNITKTEKPVLSIENWLSDNMVCAQQSPLVINCTHGIVSFSHRGVSATKATVLYIYADHTFRCRKVIHDVHKYIIQQESTTVDAVQTAQRAGDAVTAVCQKGAVIASDGNPETATSTTIEYYSAPNSPCRRVYYQLLGYIMDTWLTDCFACQFL